MDHENAPPPQPSLMHDLAHGWKQRCPACGEGALFGAYLKVQPACPHCGEPLHHHRADDLPAYIVIVLLGHMLVPLVVEVEMLFSPPMWLHALLWLPSAILLCLWMLPRVKGAVVAYQWRNGMHGFHDARQKRINDAA